MNGDDKRPTNRLMQAVKRIAGLDRRPVLPGVKAIRPENDLKDQILRDAVASPFVSDTLSSILGVQPRFVEANRPSLEYLNALGFVDRDLPNKVTLTDLLVRAQDPRKTESIISHEMFHSADDMGKIDPRLLRGTGMFGRDPSKKFQDTLGQFRPPQELEQRAYGFQKAMELFRFGETSQGESLEEVEKQFPLARPILQNLQEIFKRENP